MIRKTMVLLAGLLIATGVAQASEIDFSGTVTSIDGTPTGVAIGDSFIGKLILADSVGLSPGSSFGNGDGAYPNDLEKTLQLDIDGTDYVNDETSYGGTVDSSGNGLAGFIAASGPDDFGPTCSYCSADFRIENGKSSFDINNYPDSSSISGVFTTMIARGTGAAADVPTPANWTLFGLAVLGVFLVSRCRRSAALSVPEFA